MVLINHVKITCQIQLSQHVLNYLTKLIPEEISCDNQYGLPAMNSMEPLKQSVRAIQITSDKQSLINHISSAPFDRSADCTHLDYILFFSLLKDRDDIKDYMPAF